MSSGPLEIQTVERHGVKAVTTDHSPNNDLMAFKVNEYNLLVPGFELQGVLPQPKNLVIVPGTHSWLAGLYKYRSQAIPIIDLARLINPDCSSTTKGDVLVVGRGESNQFGILVTEAKVFVSSREIKMTQSVPTQCKSLDDSLLAAGIILDETVNLVSLERLVASKIIQSMSMFKTR